MAAMAVHEARLVAKGKLKKPNFDAVVIRDAALIQEMDIVEGAAHLIKNGGTCTSWQERLPVPPTRDRLYAAACGIAEMITYARLMCSDKPREAIEALAEEATVPFYHVGLEFGLAGPIAAATDFRETLESMRCEKPEPHADLIADVRMRSSHDDLMWPEQAALDIEFAAGLVA